MHWQVADQRSRQRQPSTVKQCTTAPTPSHTPKPPHWDTNGGVSQTFPVRNMNWVRKFQEETRRSYTRTHNNNLRSSAMRMGRGFDRCKLFRQRGCVRWLACLPKESAVEIRLKGMRPDMHSLTIRAEIKRKVIKNGKYFTIILMKPGFRMLF